MNKMELYDNHTLFQELCKTKKKWGLLLQFGWEEDHEELFKAAPILSEREDIREVRQALFDGKAYILFDTEEELDREYDRVVGDDGPTESNPYNGPARVYALTCSNEGILLTENT